MYQFIHRLSKSTILAEKGSQKFILKKISADDAVFFKRLIGVFNVHLATVFEIIAIDDVFYAVIEYVEGFSLTELLNQNVTFTPKQTAKICIDICDGLEIMYSLGIIHRDINPNNIIIKADGSACIIDYGISRIAKKHQSADTHILGTAGYTSPEQFGFRQTDFKSDIYSVGVLANFLLCGKYPNEAIAKSKLTFIVKRCVKLKPEERYKNITEVKTAFMACANQYFSEDYKMPLSKAHKIKNYALLTIMGLYAIFISIADFDVFLLLNLYSLQVAACDICPLFIPLQAYILYNPKHIIFYKLNIFSKIVISVVISALSLFAFSMLIG